MNDRVTGSSGSPGERSTSCTIDGIASPPSARGDKDVRGNSPFSLLQSSHSSHSVWLPQAHLRCRSLLDAGVRKGLISAFTRFCSCAFILLETTPKHSPGTYASG